MEDNNDDIGDNMDGQEGRPVRTLKGLLKFCMDATKSEDSTGASSFEAMSAERQQWLAQALDSMTTNTIERVSGCLKNIENAVRNTEEGTEQIIEALTELGEWVEDLDIAKDFITINGLRVIPGLMNNEVSEIRWRCFELLANLSQNNPGVQAAILAAHFLPPILLLIEADPHPTVRVKALYAMSCLSRNNVLVQNEFFANDGLSIVIQALRSEEEKIRIKASFMIASLSKDNPALRDLLLDKGLVEHMVTALKGDHCISHEHLMEAFASLADKHPKFQQCCLREEFDIKSFLTKQIQFLTGKEEFQDEKLHAEEFLASLNSPTQHLKSPAPSNMALMPA